MSKDGPRIEIIVSKNGQTTTQVFGVAGGACHVVSDAYERLFGDVVATAATAEAYEDPEQVEIKAGQK